MSPWCCIHFVYLYLPFAKYIYSCSIKTFFCTEDKPVYIFGGLKNSLWYSKKDNLSIIPIDARINHLQILPNGYKFLSPIPPDVCVPLTSNYILQDEKLYKICFTRIFHVLHENFDKYNYQSESY